MDHLITDRWIFRPARDQAPTKHSRFQMILALPHGQNRLARCDVISRLKLKSNLEAEELSNGLRCSCQAKATTHELKYSKTEQSISDIIQISVRLSPYTGGQTGSQHTVGISDQEFYAELVRRKTPTRLCCDLCGTQYRFESMSMCKHCASVVCFKCVWDPKDPKHKRQCQCGGEFD